ncbi:rod shape-determining protein MreD [Thiomicrospira sp. ALE5]|uniref:rod shape-determining protein MreD n=1 Tax=Thiomicrospira sp. ALE5 TaxID=748650 RepID=UPI0008ED3C44|nr:rod shape-determining protein MreD [Thiomicrospira sp. ALE5]SFR53146.1 rod shape-determining protein MreD [Thiomicrospira sp. ALE5]
MTDRINDLEFRKVIWLWLFGYFVALTANAINLQLTSPLFLPPLALLIAFFWASHLINASHLISAFVLGLLYDGLYQSLLGMHALLFVVFMFLMLRIRLRFRSYRIWQQALLITLYILLYQIIYYWITPIQLDEHSIWAYWSAPLLAGLLWIPIVMSFRWLTRINVTH